MLKNPQLRKTVKFTVITKKQQSQLSPITQPQSTKILNLLNVPLTQDEIDILNLGLPFTPTPKQNIAEFQNDIFQFTRKLRLTYHYQNSNIVNESIVKDYLCYKTIPSQNMSSEAQVKNFFIS